MTSSEIIIRQVEEIYGWIDSHNSKTEVECEQCGRCCDFKNYGHRLFVTTPELVYLAEKLGAENIKKANGACPYIKNNKCSIHQNRFAGCRIFFCKGDAERQSELSEKALKKFKVICRNYKPGYRYIDLVVALNNFSELTGG